MAHFFITPKLQISINLAYDLRFSRYKQILHIYTLYNFGIMSSNKRKSSKYIVDSDEEAGYEEEVV